jgi:hypothetical protein
LPKCTAPQIPILTFYQTGCDIISRDIQYPFRCFSELLFFSHSDQRKEAKERRLIIIGYSKSFVEEQV